MDKLWSPLISWTSFEFHQFRGHWTSCSASSAENFHFFRGIQKSFPTTRTTNKPFLRLRQRSLAVKNVMKERSILEYICIMSLFGSSKLFDFSSGTDNFYAQQVTKSSISITWNLTVKLRMSISLWGLPVIQVYGRLVFEDVQGFLNDCLQ